MVSRTAVLEEGMACLLQGSHYTDYRWHSAPGWGSLPGRTTCDGG